MLVAGLALAVVVLGIKSGIIMGSSWLNARRIAMAAAVFAMSVIVLSLALRSAYTGVAEFIDRYTFEFACGTGVLFVYLGLQQPRRLGPVPGLRNLRYWASFLPCPLCVGALVVSIIYTASRLHLNPVFLAAITGFAFFGTSGFAALGLRWTLTRLEADITAVFHQVLLFLGLFTLISAFLIPNIVAVMNEGEQVPITFGSARELAYPWLGFLLLFFVGILKQRREASASGARRG